jgi:hypothetical protein
MTRRLLLLAVVAAVGAAGYRLWPSPPPVAAAPPALSDAEFDRVLAAVRAAPGEDAFAEIPWLTSLWEARETAAKEGKPILLWEMDGHPLGCG